MNEAGFEDHFLPTAEGPMVHYRVYEPVGEETGYPIICLHGLTRNLLDFEDLAPVLAAMGRKVVTASQRGRGQSDPDPDPARYSPAIYTGDMLGLLDHLDIKKAIFIGTSMGGLMSMIAASAAPEKVAGVVLNDIGPEIAAEGLKRIQGYVGETGPVTSWADAAARSRAINGVAFPNETGEAFWLDFAKKTFRQCEDGTLQLAYDPVISQSVADDNPDIVDLWPLFAALRDIPTLLIRGTITDILSPETTARMQAEKPDMELAEVPDVGHAPTLSEPESLAAITAFVRQTG